MADILDQVKAHVAAILRWRDMSDGSHAPVVYVGGQAAGTAILGKVGIDQATANANEVVVKSGTVTAVTAITNSLPAGSNYLGNVNPGGTTISATPTVTAGAYSAGDAVGGVMTFANAVRYNGRSAVLNSVTITDKSKAAAELELWLFSATITEAGDNAPFTISDAELATCVGVVPIVAANYFAAADNEVACVRSVGLEFKCAATTLYGQLKCLGTPTFASASDLTVTIGVEHVS